jgi:photoactive yellow protein
MEHLSFNGVDLAELLPRIPDSIKDGLPFGLVKLDTRGVILEYNMAEGEIAGVDPKWALGKSFFDEVAVCTKTAAFYGRFVEGVKKGFLNAVFDYTFDSRSGNARVKVQMVMVPDHLGRKSVMVLVKRQDKPVVMDAVKIPPSVPESSKVHEQVERLSAQALSSGANVQDIVAAVIAALNANNTQNANSLSGQSETSTGAKPIAQDVPAVQSTGGSKIKDIFEF